MSSCYVCSTDSTGIIDSFLKIKIIWWYSRSLFLFFSLHELIFYQNYVKCRTPYANGVDHNFVPTESVSLCTDLSLDLTISRYAPDNILSTSTATVPRHHDNTYISRNESSRKWRWFHRHWNMCDDGIKTYDDTDSEKMYSGKICQMEKYCNV